MNPAPTQYYTSMDQIDELWSAIDRVRKGTTTVKVSVEALRGLMLDHHRMVKTIEDTSLKVTPSALKT